MENSYKVYSLEMELIEEVLVPKVILEQMEIHYFRDWDISNDFSMYTFSRDDLGLFLYTVDNDTLEHIATNSYDVTKTNDKGANESGDIMEHSIDKDKGIYVYRDETTKLTIMIMQKT